MYKIRTSTNFRNIGKPNQLVAIMRVLKFKLFILVYVICLFSCKQAKQNAFNRNEIKDTTFINIRANENEIDSILSIFNIPKHELPTTKQGEFVSISYQLKIPLLQRGNVTDFIGLYTTQEKYHLDSSILKIKRLTNHQIAVVTLDSSWISDNNFEGFVTQLGNSWGVGENEKGGIIIGIAPTLRRIRISTNYGANKNLSDQQLEKIIEDSIIPEFRNGNYFTGTKKGIGEIFKLLNGRQDSQNYTGR